MGDLIRRGGKAVPVQARRAEGEPIPPTMLEVPSGQAPAAPHAAVPHAAVQNVIYVTAPAAAAAPPAVTEIHHHHHTTTQVVAPARRRRPVGRGTSFLGTLGLVVGGLACGVALLPQVAHYAGRIAEAGLILAAVGWLGAVLLRRVGATMPFVGLLVSAAGYGLWLYHTGQAQSAYDAVRSKSPVALPAVRIDPPAATAAKPAPAAVQPTPAVPAKPTPRPAPPVRKGDGSIFDTSAPGWQRSPDPH